MDKLTVRQLLEAVDGALLGSFDDLDATVDSVTTDSRNTPGGSLFIPLQGERFDGHAFINSALEGGAAGCFTARERDSYLPGKFYIKVRSTLQALRDLARYYRLSFDIPFIAVTGSVGKTTAKDMIAAVLSARYTVHKTEGNYNNDVGVPLTLLKLERRHQVCVVEMGMDHAGEIDRLAALVEPDIAVITNIGDAHIENLGSREGIFHAKCEVLPHVKQGGAVILNGDDEWLATLRGHVLLDTLFVGRGEGLDYTAFDVETEAASIRCRVKTPRSQFQAEIPALGEHMIYPTLIAAAVGEKLDMAPDEIARGIGAFLPTKMRMNILRCGGDIVILNDCYNANPQSMRAAAAVLGGAAHRRKVAVVGDMKELGPNSENFHRAVGEFFAQAGTDRLIAIGDLARFMAEGARAAGLEQASYFPTVEEAKDALLRELRAGVTILVKASRSMAFERIVELLQENIPE